MKLLRLLLLFILVSSVGMTASAQCNYTLEMNDSWGDGWNGNTMDVLVNGVVVLDDVTITSGSQGTETFSVNTGDDVTTVWNGGGTYGYETSYRILDITGTQVGSGAETSITTGNITANCPSCLSATNLGASTITTTTAIVSWDAVAGASSYNWEVVPTGSGQGVGVVSSGSGAGLTGNATGLSVNTAYDLYVQTDCGGSGTSTYSGPYTFTTLPGAHSFPLTEDFESGFTSFDNAIGNDVDFAISTSYYHGGAQSIHNAYGSSNENIVHETGILDLSGTSAALLEFWHIAKTEGNYDKCYVEISTDGGATYTVIPSSAYQGTAGDYSSKEYFHEDSYGTWGTSSTTPDNATWWQKETFSLASYNLANVRFRFKLTSDGSAVRAGWYIDDIIIHEPSCQSPSSMAASSITVNSADLTWTASPSGETAWEVAIQAQGTGTPAAAGTATGSNPYNATGLTPNTDYEFYVRADCGGGDFSDWSGPHNFTTYPTAPATAQGVTCTSPGAASTIIFTENFEIDPPSGWTGSFAGNNGQWDITGGSSNSGSTGPSASYAGSNHMEYEASSNSQPDEGSVVSAAIDLTAATDDAELSFWMHAYGANMGTLDVGVGLDPAGPFTSEFTWTGQYQRTESEAWINVGVDLSGYVGQTIYIQFKATDNSTDFTSDFSIDEMSVTACVAVSTPPNCDAAMTSPADAATGIAVNSDITWSTATGFPSGYKLQIGTTMGGSEFLAQTDLMNVLTYSPASDFDFNTTYYVTITPYNGNGDATTCTEYSFTTGSGCVTATTPADGATSVNASSSASWSAITGVTGYKVSIGTTAGGTDVVNAADNGTATTYDMSGASLAYNTTYYLTIVAYNSNGDATGCTSTSFTTSANPNFGGGADGMDPINMNSGGYYFANSLAGAGASMTQPTYSWIDPVAAGHTQLAVNTGSADDGYFTVPDLGFDFDFYGTTYRTNDVFIATNGIITFGTGYTVGTSTFTLPSTGAPGACIAGCYADLDDGTNGKIYYGGDATQFVATWVEYIDYNDPSEYITFQIILEASGRVVIQYNDALSTVDELGNPSSTATLLGDALIGIQNAAEDKGIQYRSNGTGGPMFGSPMAVAFNTSESALPVEMTSFTAKEEGTVNVLAWETASEENNSHYDVERSTNGIDFEVIGTVEGNGTTVETSNYNFVDETPATVSYYRLRQVDFDGNFANSDIVIVKREGGNNNVAMFPIPVQDLLTVQYSATANEEMTITVTDVTGRTVVTKAVTATQGENQFKINLNELPSGSYFVRLQSDNSNIIRTIVKQ